MLHRSLVGIHSQFGHHVGNGSSDEAPRGQVAEPHHQADDQHDHADHDQSRQRGHPVQQVQPIRDDNRQHGAGSGDCQRKQRNPQQAVPLRFKIIYNPAEQLPVGISAIIFFSVQSVKKAHEFSYFFANTSTR